MANLRFALRMLLKTPVVTGVAVISLALGIGSNAAIFSLFNQILLRPLPVVEPERLVNLEAPGPKPGSDNCNQAGGCDEVFSYPMFLDLQREQTVFSDVAAHRTFGINVAYRDRSPAAPGPFGARFLFDEVAPETRPDPQYLQEVPGHRNPDHSLRLAADDESVAPEVEEGQVAGEGLEGTTEAAPVAEVGGPEGDGTEAPALQGVGHVDETVGLVEGQGAQEERVDHAEHRGRGADAEADGQHCHREEGWGAPQAASGVPQVTKKIGPEHG